MDLSERQALVLKHQVKALLNEFQDWRNQSNPNTALEKHHSQIVRVTNLLEKFLREVPEGVGSFEDNKNLLACLLFAQHIWAYFRGKFALRLVKILRDTLRCTDEFAWNCYQPVRDRALHAGTIRGGQLKEPPLTYFSSSAGPFIQPRETPFVAEGITSGMVERFDFALSRLPIPIIGVPWAYVNHLPSAVVIAHEIGHSVEHDFNIGPALDRRIIGLTQEGVRRQEAWLAWAGELFADTFGILCGGPAYVIALLDYLVGPSQDVMNESVPASDWRKYPPRGLRMIFNLAVLEQLGVEDGGLRESWDDAYPHHTMCNYEDFCKDAAHVADAFLTTRIDVLGGVPITDVLPMTPDEWKAIKSKAAELTAPKWDEKALFRRTFAAATWAYYMDPKSYAALPQNQALVSNLARFIPTGTRGATLSTGQQDAALRVAQDEADQATAMILAELALKT